MTQSLDSRIAKLKASAPDPSNIRIRLLCDEPWRRDRLWKVVRSLSVEHAAEIAWLDDWSGQMRVGLRKGGTASRSLIDALAIGWHSQCEYMITLCTAGDDGANSQQWCEIEIRDPKNKSEAPSWVATLPLLHS